MRDYVSDELISAYLDDEVTAEERRRVRNELAESPASRALFEEFERLQASLQDLPRYHLADDFSERVLRDVDQLGRPGRPAVTPRSLPGPGRPARRRFFRTAQLVAATVSLVALIAYVVLMSFPPAERQPAAGPPAAAPAPAHAAAELEQPGRDEPLPDGIAYTAADRPEPLFLVVCDLAITPRGQQRRVFERALQNAGIVFEAARPGVRLTPGARSQLANLLDSGFVDGVTKTSGKIESEDGETRLKDFQPFDVIEMFYAQATGTQFDALLMHDLRHRKPDCHLQIDMITHSGQRNVLLKIGGETWSVAVRDAPRNPFSRIYRLNVGFVLHSTNLAKFPTLGLEVAPRDDEQAGGERGIDLPPGFPPATKQDAVASLDQPAGPRHAASDFGALYYEILFIVRNLEQEPAGRQEQGAAGPDP